VVGVLVPALLPLLVGLLTEIAEDSLQFKLVEPESGPPASNLVPLAIRLPLVTVPNEQEPATVPEKETVAVAGGRAALALGARATAEARAVREILRNIVGDIL